MENTKKEPTKTIDELLKEADLEIKLNQALDTLGRLQIERDRLKISKINELSSMLSQYTVVDPTEGQVGSDTKFKPVFDEEEVKFIKKKIVKFIKQL